jgi:hypothetical protein
MMQNINYQQDRQEEEEFAQERKYAPCAITATGTKKRPKDHSGAMKKRYKYGAHP